MLALYIAYMDPMGKESTYEHLTSIGIMHFSKQFQYEISRGIVVFLPTQDGLPMQEIENLQVPNPIGQKLRPFPVHQQPLFLLLWFHGCYFIFQ